MKVYAISLGCPKNRVDTENLLGALPGQVVPVEDPGQADLALINTCGFIQPAVEESVAAILELLDDIEAAGARPKVVVAGCLVSRYGAEELAAELPGVDLFLSTRELECWPELAEEKLGLGAEHGRGRRLEESASAYLKIAEGCHRQCAFCAIPGIRGPLISRPMDELVGEAELLLEHGVREIILIAQDLTAYGRDLGIENGLRKLLERLAPLSGLKWLRMLYLYPTGLTDEFLQFVAGLGAPLLPYFDVPLQHAHPRILQAMGRPFAQDPRLVVERIRKHVPGAVIRTTLITGYPGEGPEEFQALVDFVNWARFDHLGVFAYWPEEGTPAATLKGRPPKKERQRRRDEIMRLQSEISEEILEDLVGLEMDVLVEAPHPEWPGLHTGRVWRQSPEVDGLTYVSGPGVEPGRFVQARIVESKTYDLVALSEGE